MIVNSNIKQNINSQIPKKHLYDNQKERLDSKTEKGNWEKRKGDKNRKWEGDERDRRQ